MIRFLIIAICIFPSYSNDSQKVWVEKDKYVVIEAERVAGGYDHTHWEMSTEPSGWTGDGYLIWKGEAIWGEENEARDYDSIEESRKLIYHVKINTPGTYYLKVRNYHIGSGKGEHPFDGDNDCFVSIAGGEFGKQYDHSVSTFSWDDTGNWRKAYLDKGIHEIAIAGRSTDFGIDRICLFHEDLAPKDGFGPSPHDWVEGYEWSRKGESGVRLMD